MLGWVAVAALSAMPIGDPSDAWSALGQPRSGVHMTADWVISCFSQPSAKGSESFEQIELAACKQEALQAAIGHCAGVPTVPERLAPGLGAIIEAAVSRWVAMGVPTQGLVWIRSERAGGQDLAVMALPRLACDAMPRGTDWLLKFMDVAESSEGWIAPAALLEAVPEAGREPLKRLLRERLRREFSALATEWPTGFTKLPSGVPRTSAAGFTVEELLSLAAKRPGDRVIWSMVVDRCRSMHLQVASSLLQDWPDVAGWPSPVPGTGEGEWSVVAVDGLPAPLIAVIRSGGTVACSRSSPSTATRAAESAFSSSPPDPAAAEQHAREAALSPDADALNLLAALRLAEQSASRDAAWQALAFAWQARSLAPDHPYATVNAVRAMRALNLRQAAAEVLPTIPKPAEGSWAHRELAKLSTWLQASR